MYLEYMYGKSPDILRFPVLVGWAFARVLSKSGALVGRGEKEVMMGKLDAP